MSLDGNDLHWSDTIGSETAVCTLLYIITLNAFATVANRATGQASLDTTPFVTAS